MSTSKRLWGSVLILLAVLAVYWPVLAGQFLWDDFLVVHQNPLIAGTRSFGWIWLRTDFPLTTTVVWLEWLAWGFRPVGFHVVNVLLHAGSALLLWRVLARLGIRGCWLAAMIFAVHPVCVGSVAWISEIKNTLSLPFFLISLYLYLPPDPELRTSNFGLRPSAGYCLSLLAFVLALFSKTSTVMLPVVLLAAAWWQRGRVTWRDGLRTSPFFLLSLAFGLLTIRFQAEGAISGAAVQSESFWGRLAGAGWALWFYLGKALLPLNLCVVYPRWNIDAAAALSYLPLALWCAALAACWAFRRGWGRHVLFALGSFTALLLPVLGFLDMYYLKISRVSDHFEYLPLVAIVALVAGGVGTAKHAQYPKEQSTEAANRGREPLQTNNLTHPPALAAAGRSRSRVFRAFRGSVLALAAAWLVGFAVLATLHARVFVNEETLWRHTLECNPSAWLAHANLGWILAEQQKYDDAQAHLEKSLELNPHNAQAHSNLARVLALQGRFADAEPHFEEAVRLKPADPDIRRAYAAVLAGQGRRDEAAAQLRELLKLRPNADARLQLAALLYQSGKPRDAVAEYRLVLAAKPDHAEALNNLAWILATCPEATVRDGGEAVRLAEHACRLKGYTEAPMLGTLAAAYAEAGRLPEAVATSQKMIDIARAGQNTRLAAVGQQFLTLFRSGKPYHETGGDNSAKRR